MPQIIHKGTLSSTHGMVGGIDGIDEHLCHFNVSQIAATQPSNPSHEPRSPPLTHDPEIWYNTSAIKEK